MTLHGDYTPRNVLCGPGLNVTVLDTTLSQRGPAAYDVSWFLAGLSFLNRWQLVMDGRIYDKEALAQVRTAFLDGYQRLGELPDPKALALFRAKRLLQRWGQYATHLHHTQPGLARVLLPRQIHPYFQSRVEAALVE